MWPADLFTDGVGGIVACVFCNCQSSDRKKEKNHSLHLSCYSSDATKSVLWNLTGSEHIHKLKSGVFEVRCLVLSIRYNTGCCYLLNARHLSVFYWREKICYRTVDGHIYEHCRMFYRRGLVERHYKPFSQTSRNRQGTIGVRHRCWQLWQSTCLTTTKPNSFEDLTWPSVDKMLL